MRNALDFAPLYRSSIGFECVLNLLEEATQAAAGDTWPPYDIEKADEDNYRITLAVAGFAESELHITTEPNLLTIRGDKASTGSGTYLHRGITAGSFARRFELADHIRATGASLVHGLLTIDLMRDVPAALKPRRIEIGTGDAIQRLPGVEQQAA